MIVSSCPTRISLGSADHNPFAEKWGGCALNLCINKKIYVIIRKRNHLEEFKYRISYSKTQLCNEIDEIEHPLVREAIRFAGVTDPLEIIYTADVPAKLGLATSSAMSVALIKGLFHYRSVAVSPEILADYAYTLERDKLKEVGGFQDFYCCFGGLQYLTGSPRKVVRKALPLTPDKADALRDHMLLIYTGNQELSYKVLPEQLKKLKKGTTLEETLQIKRLVEEMQALIQMSNFEPMHLAHALKDGWELKKKLSSTMTNEQITEVENKICSVFPQAGYRLVGSGGGRGFILVLAPPEHHDNIKKVVRPLKTFDFEFDWEGAKVITTNSFCGEKP
jgi:D-glycero-alpha-D-manno-heptose-7-phosphate kinase